MSTLLGRTESALLIVDVQNDVMAPFFGRDAVISTINELVAKARASDTPIVWVQHNDDEMTPGSDGWQLCPELDVADTDLRVNKQHGDSFEGTDLEAKLESLNAAKLIVAGAETDACIRSTIHGAFARGYDTYLVGDAHTAMDKSEWGAPPVESVIAHTNLYWRFQSAPGKTAGVLTSAEVVFD